MRRILCSLALGLSLFTWSSSDAQAQVPDWRINRPVCSGVAKGSENFQFAYQKCMCSNGHGAICQELRGTLARAMGIHKRHVRVSRSVLTISCPNYGGTLTCGLGDVEDGIVSLRNCRSNGRPMQDKFKFIAEEAKDDGIDIEPMMAAN